MRQRKRNRLKEFDYSQTGYYFITICTDNMINFFGNVINSDVKLNRYGNIVKNRLTLLQKNYPYVTLDEFVIMPNHVHVILVIDRSSVGTTRELSLPIKTKSLSGLVGVFKTTSSKEIHNNGLSEFKWQRSFYDRVIRNEKELFQIKKYIIQNPLKWEIEKETTENIEL